MARVDATHVQRGIGFQIAKCVGLCEDGIVGQARIFHAGQDVVAGAVHDAHHALDPVARKAFCQSLHTRDATRDGSLEP